MSKPRDTDRQLHDIANQIRARREELGLSQEALAERLNISVETIKRIEQQRGWVSLKMLYGICRKLKIKILIG